jgi:hypothetical protein
MDTAAPVITLSQSDSDSDGVQVSLPVTRDGSPSEAVVLPGNFQRAILKDVLSEDGLLVISRGLGCRDIISKMLQLYCSSKSLVFVLNASADEAWRVRQALSRNGTRFPSLLLLWCQVHVRLPLSYIGYSTLHCNQECRNRGFPL